MQYAFELRAAPVLECQEALTTAVARHVFVNVQGKKKNFTQALVITAERRDGLRRACGVGLAFLLFLSQLMQNLFDNQYFWQTLRAGMQARVALVNAVAAKVLRLSHCARSEHTTGRPRPRLSSRPLTIPCCAHRRIARGACRAELLLLEAR
mmetsp:Transcript_22692/g.61456  ORF Transcript_22692/g.61456 Transcript_22692/m.61456 type:complete len:152 (-) Transcript_22692:161-616(-)